MAEIIKLAAMLLGIAMVFVLAFGALNVGRVVDSVSWFAGKCVALVLYALCIIFLCGAFGRFDWMYANVDGLSGFRVYWVYAIVAALLPFIGTARISGFLSVLIIIPCLGVLANG